MSTPDIDTPRDTATAPNAATAPNPATGPETATAPETAAAADGDRLTRLRQQLAAVGDLPVSERVEVFASVNQALVAELSSMDDVDGIRSPRAAGDHRHVEDVHGHPERDDVRGRAPGGRRHEGPPAP